jgi:hypothetical protein
LAVTKSQDRSGVSLLDLLIDGFEKNEVLEGFHWRTLPMPDELSAEAKFESLVAEAERWKGPARRTEAAKGRRLVAWPDMDIRQADRGILLRVKTPRFEKWWHDRATWEGDPLEPIYSWVQKNGGS